jgi:tetratricopeptide (TPR) repeat protein
MNTLNRFKQKIHVALSLPVFALLLNIATSTHAQTLDWQALIADSRLEEAKKLCPKEIASADLKRKAAGNKCMANIALNEGSAISLNSNELGGGTVSSGYTNAAVDKAIAFLNAGLAADPQDLSIHQGRLWVLMTVRRYDAMMDALKNSIVTYKGEKAVDAWLSYSADMFNDGHMSVAIRLLKELEIHYPEEHRIQGNLAGAFAMLKDDKQALVHGRLAVKLSPDDPINNWNLGRTLDYTGEYAEAEKYYTHSLTQEAKRKGTVDESRRCILSALIAEKLNTPEKLCQPTWRGCKKYDEACDLQVKK